MLMNRNAHRLLLIWNIINLKQKMDQKTQKENAAFCKKFLSARTI